MRLRAHHKLFLSYSLLVAAVVVALTVGVEVTLREPLIEQAGDELHRELSLGRDIFDRDSASDPDSLARHMAELTGHRVTVVARNGRVVGESGVPPARVAELENHLERPEVAGALADGTGRAVRRSVSVDRDLMYAAVPTERGPVLRFAVGIEEIDAAVARVRWQVLYVGAIALGLAALFSLGFSLAVTRPLRRMRDIANAMAGGDLDARVRIARGDELGELGAALDQLAAELQRRLGQLEAERGEMQALIDSMAEGVLALGPDGAVRRANPAARRMFELTEAPSGIPPEEVDRRTEFLRLVDRVLGGEPVPPTELTRQGEHLLATAAPLPQGGGVLVFLDTTELRRLEGVRRDFVANASHELKTPLTVIRGYAETLTDDSLPSEIRGKFTRTLKANADRLQAILDDLLDLSRIESGGWSVEAEGVDVRHAASEAWEPFVEAAGSRGIGFRVEVEPGSEEVHADPDALGLVFSNLLGNAVRYTPEGGSIEVRAAPLPASAPASVARPDSEPGWVRIEVRDTGSGIPASHLDRIFERFYRVDPARSREEGGTGLGLSIVRHLVERHGGTVEAESEVGEGTTIRFTLRRRAGTSP